MKVPISQGVQVRSSTSNLVPLGHGTQVPDKSDVSEALEVLTTKPVKKCKQTLEKVNKQYT